MVRKLGWRTIASFLLSLSFASTGVSASTPCSDRPFDFYQEQGYVLRSVIISGFLPLRRSLEAVRLIADIEGKPFSLQAMARQRAELREELRRAPSLFDSPVSITVVGEARAVNCSDLGNPKELDIEYAVFTTKLPLNSVRTLEHRELERTHPAEALAFAPTKSMVRLTPLSTYDASQQLRLGALLEAKTPWANTRLYLESAGSTESFTSSAAVAGRDESDQGAIRTLIWRSGAEYSKRPSDRTILESGRGLAQFTLVTKPFGPAVIRAGTLVEGGLERTRLPQAGLPESLLASSTFGNWKMYAGLSLRTGRHSVAASYGLLLGHTPGQLVAYRKQIADIVYDARWLVSPHHPLELNGRFTAGFLTKPGPTPVSEQFFGGNVETPFMPGSEWVIRANPVIRGIPAYRLNRTEDNQVPGTDRFSVLNLTAAFAVWGIPLIPAEASQDQEVRDAAQGLVAGGVDVLTPIYELDDPAQKELLATTRNPFVKTTAALSERVTLLAPAISSTLRESYDMCAEKAGDLAADAENISGSTPWRTFLADDPEDRGIPVIVKVCLEELNGSLNDAELTRLGEELKEHQNVIDRQVARIDTMRARRSAEEMLEFPRAVLETVFDEMTIVSISPVVMFDVGRIGRPAPGVRSLRYSVGGATRFTLASTVAFQIGYAWNIHPQPWEGRGALSFGVQFIDLFGK